MRKPLAALPGKPQPPLLCWRDSEMVKPNDSITHQQVDVDWNKPELQDLLAKIEGLRLDNRGMFKPRPVVIRAFWPRAHELGSGQLVANDGQGNWVIRTDFPLDIGMGLTIGQRLDELDSTVHYLCEVRSCRRGLRPEDEGKNVFISTLYCQRSKG
jgi:hypothetical protein